MAASIISFDSSLLPIARMASAGGPINVTPCHAKSERNERNERTRVTDKRLEDEEIAEEITPFPFLKDFQSTNSMAQMDDTLRHIPLFRTFSQTARFQIGTHNQDGYPIKAKFDDFVVNNITRKMSTGCKPELLCFWLSPAHGLLASMTD